MEIAVARQIRDLSIIAGSIPDRSRLLFVAQPFAASARVDLSREEEELFKLADGMQGQHWQIMKYLLVELWPAYVGELEQACSQNGIMFMDLNRSEISGWAYVDRVHMTDAGYRQVAKSIASVIA